MENLIPVKGKISSSVTEISVAKTEISVTGPARLLISYEHIDWSTGRLGSYEEALSALATLINLVFPFLFKFYNPGEAKILKNHIKFAKKQIHGSYELFKSNIDINDFCIFYSLLISIFSLDLFDVISII